MTIQPGSLAGLKKWPIRNEVPDLTGKVALVTGANSPGGMGFHTAYQLASKNAKVYIGARSASKAQSAIQEMRKENPSITEDQLVPFVTDLGDIKAVRDACRAMLQSESRLDILVHNAAIISMPVVINSDGISASFAANHFGPFVLTNTLIPLLTHAAEITGDARVVTISATAYKFLPPGVRFDSINSFNQEMEPTTLGGADFTRYNGVKNWLPAEHLEGRLTPAEGVVTALFAATSPKIFAEKNVYKGAFLVPPGSIEALVGDASDDKLAQELWVTSERIVEAVCGKSEI
ncbi:putative oxidoreductase C736,13 [Talaromyces islandicus]|uniref:Putative oxidoreductase C736,13 n=1 Tax=Talaromyces islandicus TaxID=28573 RepID=A0A0U1LYG1_TALIS|nr:putative oxidoreductase C736,13 [Talaromyces islandicus]